MNPVLNPIFARRSVRAFTGEAVSDELVKDLLEAAMSAPSACACDPWHFILLNTPERRRTVADHLPHGRMMAQAGAGIVVCGDRERAHDQQESYMIQDCSAAIENLLLAASMLGLGAVWLGIHPREERMLSMRGLLGLPARAVPIAAIAIGWPAETPAPRTRFQKERVHVNGW